MLPNLLLLLAPLAAAPATPAAPAMQSPATFPGATLGESLARVTERDGRVSFTPRSGVLAQRALERLGPERAPLAPGSVLEWSEALFALGAGGDVSARVGLGDLAAEAGSQPQGLAAILALGALGPRLGSARQDLLDWAGEDDETRRRHALLAVTCCATRECRPGVKLFGQVYLRGTSQGDPPCRMVCRRSRRHP